MLLLCMFLTSIVEEFYNQVNFVACQPHSQKLPDNALTPFPDANAPLLRAPNNGCARMVHP